jgi:ferric-dicitrate binding protein FerR (iron transport regulator)
MDCQRATTLISAALDLEIQAADRRELDDHLVICAECRSTNEAFLTQDRNLRRLFGHGEGEADQVVERVLRKLSVVVSDDRPEDSSRPRPRRPRRAWVPAMAAMISGLILISYTVFHDVGPMPKADVPTTSSAGGTGVLTARPRPAAAPADPLAVGNSIQTGVGERRRVTLPDGSILYINANTTAQLDTDRHLILSSGEVFLDVAPRSTNAKSVNFVVQTPSREVRALGTKFAVKAEANQTGVVVTQGKVQVSGLDDPIVAGQQVAPGETTPMPSPRASHLLDWTKELMAAAEAPLVPASQFRGGALVAIDPFGQEAKLSLRKFHIDVHIEDGFARTTVDQTYFNHDPWRMEGTFYFPLPPDAALSRLAMYVDGKLMEGGMAERDYARQVFETIRYTQRDPALLEWVDGSTFKMRVFPLEPRQEKRLILCYTQKLETLYGRTRYRFPAGHSIQNVNDWSFSARIKGGVGIAWSCPTHAMKESKEANDLVLSVRDRNVKPDKDVVLSLMENDERQPVGESIRFSSAMHEGNRYLMLRYRPLLASTQYEEAGVPAFRPRRDWVFLFESSGDRDPLLARVQVDVIRTLLENAEPGDTFAVLTAGTRVQAWAQEPRPVSPDNVKAAVEFLEHTRLVGALDLGHALDAARPLLEAGANPHLLHVGSGIAAMGERRDRELADRILVPGKNVRYVGIGVGKRWARNFMKSLAERSGGYFTQINPDEPATWRAFELLATLNTPRLMGIAVQARQATGWGSLLALLKRPRPFLCCTNAVAQGEELCAVTRLGADEKLPESVAVTGTLDGNPFERIIPVAEVAENADYLPRTWAKLEIDRLLAEDAQKNKDPIVALSKAMYVMTPFTSLLVLENETMYAQYKVDRGRKDHWATYPCPERIPVVTEPAPGQQDLGGSGPKTAGQVMQTILVRIPPRTLTYRGDRDPFRGHQVVDARQSLTVLKYGTCDPKEVEKVLDDLESILSHLDTGENKSGKTNDFSDWAIGARLDIPETKSDSSMRSPVGMVNDAPLGIRESGRRAVSVQAVQEKVAGGGVMPGSRVDVIQSIRRGIGETDARVILQNIEVLDVNLPAKQPRGDGLTVTDDVNLSVTPQEALILDRATRTGTISFALRRKGDDSVVDLDYRFPNRALPFPLTQTGRLLSRPLSTGGVVGDIYADYTPPDPVLPFPLYSGRAETGGFFTGMEFVLWRKTNARGHQISATRGLVDYDISGEGRRPNSRVGQILIHGNEVSRPDVMRRLPHVNRLRLDDSNRNFNSNAFMAGLRPETTDGRRLESIAFDEGIGRVATAATDDLPLLWAGSGPRIPLYQRPVFNSDDRLFTDLVAYAPGMNTSRADILAVLETEALPRVALRRGTIDPTARRLIDGARTGGWRELAIGEGQAVLTVRFNGQGQYAYTRSLPIGLREEVVCDGNTILDLYPELGVGAKRNVSRFHREELAGLVPWFLPPAEDIVHGADLTCVDDRTVAIMPHDVENLKDADGKAIAYLVIHLRFDPAGQLAERRLVEMPSGKVFRRETYDADGVVKLLDASGKVLAERRWAVRDAAAPDLKPNTDKVVLLPLPFRTKEHIRQALKTGSNYEDLDAGTALALFAAEWAGGNKGEALQIDGGRFRVRNIRPIGFYVLLAACGHNVDAEQLDLNVLVEHPHELLAEYLAFHTNPELRRHAHRGGIGGPRDGLLQRLAEFRALFSYWHNNKAKTASADARRVEQVRALEYIRRDGPPLLRWALLNELQDQAGDDAALLGEVAQAWTLFEKTPGLGYVARFEKARCLLTAGQRVTARKLFLELYASTLQSGVLPPIDHVFRQALQNQGSEPEEWAALIERTATKLLKENGPWAVLVLARQCWELDDHPLAGRLITMVLDGVTDGPERWRLTAAAMELLLEMNQLVPADELLETMLANEKLARSSYLWRLGQQIADRRHQSSRSLHCLEKALAIEYRHLPEVINLEEVRKDYGDLLARYQKLADAAVTLQVAPPDGLESRVVSAADRWRAMDPDGTGACQTAAKILQSLGSADLAWEYMTTPIGLQPNEAGPWLNLAESQRKAGDYDLADRAFAAAFDAEPTNAQILWDRAQNLQRIGKSTQAQALLRKLADGQWQPRFSGLQAQARWQVGRD